MRVGCRRCLRRDARSTAPPGHPRAAIVDMGPSLSSPTTRQVVPVVPWSIASSSGRSMPDSGADGGRLESHMRPARAVAFDFNGTLSDDEPILLSVYRELFAEQNRPLTDAEYYDTLAGLSEEAIIGTWLGVEGDALASLVEERIERYLARCGSGETVSAPVRDAVSYAARRVPVAVVSGAFRREIEPVLVGAGLAARLRPRRGRRHERGKPDPAAYALAVDPSAKTWLPDDVVAFEDTEAGVSSAKAAGLRCVAVRRYPPAGPARAGRRAGRRHRRRRRAAARRVTLVIAHRGACWELPENTLAAFERAIESARTSSSSTCTPRPTARWSSATTARLRRGDAPRT